MKKYFLKLLLINLVFTTCKKKTDIQVRLYNPYLDEYVQGATVAIIERKGNEGGGILTGEVSCKEVATAKTDASGIAIFNETKLKRREGYVYYPVTKEAWGVLNNYPCGGYNGKYITKGKYNTIIKSDRTDGGVVRVQYNNLFNTAMSGDSIYVNAYVITNYDPELGHDVGGAGVHGNFIAFDSSLSPYPSIKYYDSNINGKIIINIRKRKMGIVSARVDTVKAYPNQTTTIQINW
ncbi:MAG: hypothetical protein KAZ71_01340 [Bacteroidia bacterium]|nr:hypothetical protein [Bacteroidia bacterium]